MEAKDERRADNGFRFSPRLVAVFGDLDETHRQVLERATGSPAVILSAPTGGQACGLSAVAGADAGSVQAELQAALGSGVEVGVYQHTGSHPELESGPLHDAAAMMAVRVYADDHWREPFRRWLQDEHLSRQPATPGVKWAHLYERVDEDGWHFLNLWGADDTAVYDSEEWVRIRGTEWYERIAAVFTECRTERQILRVPTATGA